MSGRATFRDGEHPSRAGGIVEPVQLDQQTLDALRAALGRTEPFTDAEKAMIEDRLADLRHLYDLHREGLPGREDVGATLRALGKLDGQALRRALADADEIAFAFVLEALAGVLPADVDDVRLEAAVVSAVALFDSRKGKPGRHHDAYLDHAIPSLLHLWHALGGDPQARAWRNDTTGALSPLVMFVVGALRIVERGTRRSDATTTIIRRLQAHLRRA